MYQNNIQNQYNSRDVNIEEIIRPFKEKVKKLNDELLERDTEMANLKYKLMQYNNSNNNISQTNPMMDSSIHHMTDTTGSKMDMLCNGMIEMGNQMNQINNNNNQKESQEDKNNLRVKAKLENGAQFFVQYKSEDKMKEIINSICTINKIQKAEDYDFTIIKEEKVNLDSTVEQSGLKKQDYILVKKKLSLNKGNQSLNDKQELKNNYESNPKILGRTINLNFVHQSGQKINIQIGLNNTFKDAVITFCKKVNVNPSQNLKDLAFVFKTKTINIEDNRILEQIGFKSIDDNTISVIDSKNIIGRL